MITQCGEMHSPSRPDVPIMQKAGLTGFVVNIGFIVIGPAGILQPVLEKRQGMS